MSNNLYKGVVKLTKEQFDELKENGTITIGSQVYTYSPKDTTYVVEDNMTAQVAQNTSDIAQLKTDMSTLEDSVSTLQSGVQSNTTDISNLETDKLDKNQGIANAGKVMLIGDDGNLTPQSLADGGTTVTVNGQPQTTWDADTKADVSSLASVATSGSYEDLTGKPTIPTDNSQLTNGAGYATTSQLPTNNNQLTNGAGYVTQTEVNSAFATKTAVNVDGELQQNLNFDSDPQTQFNNLNNKIINLIQQGTKSVKIGETIVNWGIVIGALNYTANYETPYTESVSSIIVSPVSFSKASNYDLSISNPNLTGFKITASSTVDVYWVAIGK